MISANRRVNAFGFTSRDAAVARMLEVFLLLFAALAISGCASSRGGEIPYDRTDFVAPDLPKTALSEADHRLQPGDIVTVNVFQVEALSGDRQLDATGKIQMPLIGPLAAQGMTTAQLSQDLTTKLNASYLKQARVEVILKTAQQRTITVDGAVRQPGIYPVGGQVSLLQAVALARGPDENANVKRIVVFRQINGQRQAASFDLSTIRTGQDPDPAIYGNDVIVVDGSGNRKAIRDLLSAVPLLAIFSPL